jgi:SP family arabinose:H+ symporter-like MFS transporter
MALSLIVLCLGFRMVPAPFALVIGSILVYVAAFATGVGPGVWVYISELFPTSLRGRAMSVATAALWGACILVTNTFLTAVRLLTPSGAFLFYAAMCAVLCGFVFLLPETRGRSLEEIASLWEKSDRENASPSQA